MVMTYKIGDPVRTPQGDGEVSGVEFSEGTNWVFVRIPSLQPREFRFLCSEVTLRRDEVEKRGFRD